MAKRASERYSTAKDLADDLRHFLADQTEIHSGTTPGGVVSTGSETPASTPTSVGSVAASSASIDSASSDSQPIKIVPKGLRSFDAHDADFFLELLPGPRDREGLPDSLRFWKTRIEETDPDNTFSVGLIYGPSGCGKSSLVKAGLLPRLSEDVISVYIEATPNETETRLLRRLRKRCPALEGTLNLKETLATLRRGQGIPMGTKVLIVLDQFEQWLHAKKEEQNTELVRALRQCDGGRVQCIVMVRDDFWMAVTRFLNELEVELVQGQNFVPVDLFPIRHAQKVLAAFGRAFGSLADVAGKTTEEEKDFLKQSAAGLAEEGKVICVRLALFAEMMKGKQWTPTTLNEVGGTKGVGVTFLEETFSSSTASPKYRLHQRAARAVLKSLLPESGTDIKGQMKSYEELLEASGYTNRPRDFDELLRILDGELRLITPTDPEGSDTESGRDLSSKYYQLTHDYLVVSLSNWLTRKQQETRRGRAELRLAERTALWIVKPENRHLPSWTEWASIRLLTDNKHWTEPQRKMMRKAGRVQGTWFTLLTFLIVGLTFTGIDIKARVDDAGNEQHAAGLVTALLNADIQQVPDLITDLRDYRHWADPKLEEEYGKSAEFGRERLHISLALLPADPGQVDYLKGRLLAADPSEVDVIRQALEPYRTQILEDLWRVVETHVNDEGSQILQASSALALYESERKRWKAVAERIVATFVNENTIRAAVWIDLLKPIRKHLVDSLGNVFRDSEGKFGRIQQQLATDILEQYAADDVEKLADLILDAEPKQFQQLFDDFARHGRSAIKTMNEELNLTLDVAEGLTKRKANAALALLRMDQSQQIWPLLKHTSDPSLRSWIIHRIAQIGGNLDTVAVRLDKETDPSILRALILSLDEYGSDSQVDRDALASKVLSLYESHADPGLHGAAEWLLHRWDKSADIAKVDVDHATGDIIGDRHWYVTRHQGHTMVVFRRPVEFLMGSPTTEQDRNPNLETQHRRLIDRSFSIASKEVTVRQFQKFIRDTPGRKHNFNSIYAPELDCPQVSLTWYDAAAYCRWLSDKENIPEQQMCYPPISEIKEGLKLPPNYLSRTGYRLPTEAEWEYACRAETLSSRYYGESEELLDQYAWHLHNANDRTWPVGRLKPNDFGLFDMLGNVKEWCQTRYRKYRVIPKNMVIGDQENDEFINEKSGRSIRGGSFTFHREDERSAFRNGLYPNTRLNEHGFRLARTISHSP